MSSDVKQIEGTIETIKGLTDQVVFHTGGNIDQNNEALDYHIHTLEKIIRLKVARVEAKLIRPLAVLSQSANFHIVKAYFHASPGLIAILAAIWTVVSLVWKYVKQVLAILQLLQALKIWDLLSTIWPAFKAAREKFRTWVAELSEAIGWGVDGLLHLIHATQAAFSVYGGLAGKDNLWLDAQWMVKTGNILDNISKQSKLVTADPGRILEMFFQGEEYKNLRIISRFGDELMSKIDTGLSKAVQALTGMVSVADELASIQEGMPDIIRENIPVGIWEGLEKFTDVIEDEILPRVRTAEKHLAMVDAVLNSYFIRMNDMADKLTHPGTNLLRIDDLASYLQDREEAAIDDVASRKFGEAANYERDAMESDLAAFAIIDAAATSPLPALPFMTIEEPGRAALHGITAEPHETWFIGGYKDQF